ncbi:tRNA (guanine(37)-N1)-methyltransferase [Lachnellula subtilissima]|uniref:tRNA (guanine(37)-N1)-methyltransferase n=1 Tax=Lachnellula subtilissima TaxID=602034 RepID=A0A8H8RQ98_9HELO|nr:tRNA (guanine(37)-N1)-methyltransferase [Lachnellula subtilissima]
MSLFRPPIVRSATAALDRSLFSKTFPIAAARVLNPKNIPRIQIQLNKSHEVLNLERRKPVEIDPDPALASKGGKCLLLNPDVKPYDSNTWSKVLQEASEKDEIKCWIIIIGHTVPMSRIYYFKDAVLTKVVDIMTSLLPEDAQAEIPTGFTMVGHVAHLNLRDEYLPYKKIIAEVIVDKNPTIRTVINKTNNVGTESEFRTFGYEVLFGPDDMNVEVGEGDCVFKFDYSKVYWNSRLQTEHKRIVDMFNPGEVVCDVMAGIGPFALPAGKKEVFVLANDLNPESYKYLKEGIVRNKVSEIVQPFNEDGHTFIQHAADHLLNLTATSQNTITLPLRAPKRSRRNPPSTPAPTTKTLTIPTTISHFVMNLPAIAISFLPSFNGLYHGHDSLFYPHTATKLPMIHVHCFSTKSDDNVRETAEICQRVSEALGFEIRPGEQEMSVHEVRDVAPKKRMFCASFRLPAEVAFRERKAIGEKEGWGTWMKKQLGMGNEE